MSEARDGEGNIMVVTERLIDQRAHNIRVSDLMLDKMDRGDAILLTTSHRGELQMEIIPHYRLYHR